MVSAKMARIFAYGLTSETDIKSWWEAMDKVPGHKVLSFNRKENGYLLTYRHEPDERALNEAVLNVVSHRTARMLLGLPLRLMRLPLKS